MGPDKGQDLPGGSVRTQTAVAEVVDVATIKPEHVCKPPEAIGFTHNIDVAIVCKCAPA